MKVYVEAYGCSQNIAETYMLANSMGEIVYTPDDADTLLIGTCVVIAHTEHRMLRRIRELKKYRKPVIVYGCLPSARRELLEPDIIPIPTWKFRENVNILGKEIVPMNGLFMWDAIATIPIANGCLGNCTYCITKIARGTLRSYPPDWILEKVKKAISQGAVEIRFSAQDTAAYGRDMGTSLPEMLEKILSLSGKFMVRIGMMEPREAYRILQPLIKVYGNPGVYKFLHIPVQSGNNEILRLMNRGYTRKEFEEIISRFRSEISDITISTDIIVGFPGEDNDAFEDTYKLVERVRPEILNITRFSPRPKTPAYKWKSPSTNKVKDWSARLSALHREIVREKLQSLVGKEMPVIVPSRGKKGRFLARTREYRPVILENAEIGKFYRVEIIDAGESHLKGRILQEENTMRENN